LSDESRRKIAILKILQRNVYPLCYHILDIIKKSFETLSTQSLSYDICISLSSLVTSLEVRSIQRFSRVKDLRQNFLHCQQKMSLLTILSIFLLLSGGYCLLLHKVTEINILCRPLSPLFRLKRRKEPNNWNKFENFSLIRG
jgi:hypothetical protein